MHLEVPKNHFERILFAASLAKEISGKETTKKEIMDSAEARGFQLTDEELRYIDDHFK